MNETLASIAARIYTFLLPLSWIGVVVALLVLIPMAIAKRTRQRAGMGFFLASWLFGLTTWMLGATVTFATFGWLGLVIGTLFAGVGVVPIGIFAAFVAIKSTSLGLSLIVMSVIVFACRWGGLMLADAPP